MYLLYIAFDALHESLTNSSIVFELHVSNEPTDSAVVGGPGELLCSTIVELFPLSAGFEEIEGWCVKQKQN